MVIAGYPLNVLTQTTYLSELSPLDKKTQLEPSQEVINNLRILFIDVIDVINQRLGKPVRVISAYRSLAVNQIVYTKRGQGQSRTARASAHIFGLAADVRMPDGNWAQLRQKLKLANSNYNGNRVLLELIKFMMKEKQLILDQVISEEGTEDAPSWIHVGIALTGNRMAVLRHEAGSPEFGLA